MRTYIMFALHEVLCAVVHLRHTTMYKIMNLAHHVNKFYALLEHIKSTCITEINYMAWGEF